MEYHISGKQAYVLDPVAAVFCHYVIIEISDQTRDQTVHLLYSNIGPIFILRYFVRFTQSIFSYRVLESPRIYIASD